MLDVEDHFMIKDLFRKGVSISEIARRTGHDRKTVRKLATAPLRPTRQRARAIRPHKLDPYLPHLAQRLADGVTNARKLFAEIRDLGYPGKYTRVKDWVQTHRAPRTAPATVRFETPPGEQAQVDFAAFGTITHHGREHRLYALLMTLGFSRMLFVTFSVSCDWVAFLRGHQAAFAYFDGIPRTVLHDNLKSAVLHRRGGQPQFHPRYLDFADYHGFTPKACQPYRAQTKGKVERAVQYLRGNFWQGLRHTGLDDLNDQVRVWLDTVANVRVHATTGVTPVSRLVTEGLTPLGTRPPYPVAPVVVRQASRDGWVQYAGNAYAVPLTMAGQPVLVQLGTANDLVLITATGAHLAQYALAHAHGTQVGQPSGAPAATTTVGAVPARPTAAPLVERRALSAYDVLVEAA
jgi:transposase